MLDEPTADRVARLTAWQPLRRLTDVVHVLADTWRVAGATHDHVHELRSIMATSAEQIAAINANLTNIQGDVQRLNTDLTSLRDEIADQDPALAARLQPLVDLSGQIAAATPDPAPGPDGGGEPTPTPDEPPAPPQP